MRFRNMFSRTMQGKAMRNGRLVDGGCVKLEIEMGSESEEFKYDAESVSVIPVDNRIESRRCRQDTNTGIFWHHRSTT